MPSRIKGAAIREFLVYVRDQMGEDAIVALTSDIPREYEGLIDPRHPSFAVLPSTWYDARFVHAILDASVGGLPPDRQEQLVRDGTLYMMERTLGGPYKQFFLRVFLSPDVYVKHAQKLWNLHFDEGRLSVTRTRDNTLLWEMRAWRGYHPMIHRIVVASEPYVFGSMGLSNVYAERVPPREGVVCSHRIVWDHDPT